MHKLDENNHRNSSCRSQSWSGLYIHAPGGISSKMNVSRKATVELILQLECWKQLLIKLDENNYIKVERPWPWLFDLEKLGSMPLAKSPASQELLTDPDCAPESAKSVSTSRTSTWFAWRDSYSKGKPYYYLLLGFIACLKFPIPHEWAKSRYECLKCLRIDYDSVTMSKNALGATNQARFLYESGNSWLNFWTVQTFEPNSR